MPSLAHLLRSSLITVSLLAAGLLPALRSTGAESTEFSKGTIDVGIVVQDSARTAAFLTNAIGFREVEGFSVTPELGRKIGLVDGHAVRVRVFVLEDAPQATRIKVLSFPGVESRKPDQQFIHSTLGISYLTLYVKDVNRALERLRAAQVKTEGETPVDLGGGTYLVTVRDPDGNLLELIGPRL